MYPLEIDHLTKRYGHEVVVNDLTFTVPPGKVTCFLGPNGAGKSTAMKVLLGLAAADHGHATIGGTRYRDIQNPARTVGVALEPNAFHPGRSGRNHLRVLTDSIGIPPTRIDEMLEMVELTLAGAIGAVLGAGLGALIRNVGGAVTTAVLVLFVLPGLVVQLITGAASWIPPALFAVISGVSTDVGLGAAVLAIAAWALVPAAAGLVAVQRRDVV